MRRTLRILEVLAEHPDGLGVTRISERLGDAPSSIHRLLGVLVEGGYVIQDDARRYRLGPKLLMLSRAYERGSHLVTVAKPLIAILSTRTMESVFVSEQNGDDAVCVAAHVSPRPVTLNMRLGARTPYHASASARAILAFQAGDRQLRLLQAERIERYTDRTPTTVAEALDELTETRKRGYAFCEQERELGVSAISAPIHDADGAVFASVTIVAPHDRLTGEGQDRILAMLLDTAAAISAELGYEAVAIAGVESALASA